MFTQPCTYCGHWLAYTWGCPIYCVLEILEVTARLCKLLYYVNWCPLWVMLQCCGHTLCLSLVSLHVPLETKQCTYMYLLHLHVMSAYVHMCMSLSCATHPQFTLSLGWQHLTGLSIDCLVHFLWLIHLLSVGWCLIRCTTQNYTHWVCRFPSPFHLGLLLSQAIWDVCASSSVRSLALTASCMHGLQDMYGSACCEGHCSPTQSNSQETYIAATFVWYVVRWTSPD